MRTFLPLFAVAIAGVAIPAKAQNVPVSAFRSVQLIGGGTVTLRQGPVQRVTLTSGSTAFTEVRVKLDGRLEITACNRRCPRNYSLNIDIVSPHAPDVAIRGGGEIRAAKFSRQAQISAAVHGGGTIDVRAVPARDVSAAVSEGGEILVRPLASLSAAVNGGGEVAYAGNPHVSQAVAGGGAVRRLR